MLYHIAHTRKLPTMDRIIYQWMMGDPCRLQT